MMRSGTTHAAKIAVLLQLASNDFRYLFKSFNVTMLLSNSEERLCKIILTTLPSHSLSKLICVSSRRWSESESGNLLRTVLLEVWLCEHKNAHVHTQQDLLLATSPSHRA
jgi:hypothetical protein